MEMIRKFFRVFYIFFILFFLIIFSFLFFFNYRMIIKGMKRILNQLLFLD